MPMMMMPIVTCRCSWRRAEQIIQNMNDSADISLGSSVSVLKSRVQSTAECAGIYTFAMMMHTLYYGALSASRILLRGELLQFLREVTRCLSKCTRIEGGRFGWLLHQRRTDGTLWIFRFSGICYNVTPRSVHATELLLLMLTVMMTGAEFLPGLR